MFSRFAPVFQARFAHKPSPHKAHSLKTQGTLLSIPWQPLSRNISVLRHTKCTCDNISYVDCASAVRGLSTPTGIKSLKFPFKNC